MYKERKQEDDNQNPKQPRVFGGKNVIFLGDFWQLAPVHNIGVFDNPWPAKPIAQPSAALGMQIFMGDGYNTIQKCWNLTQSMRCADAWFNAFLEQCRNGCLTADMHALIHGFSTTVPLRIADAILQIPAQKYTQQCTCHEADWKTNMLPGLSLIHI